MKDILILTPKESRNGFALTGVRQQTVVPEESWHALRQAVSDPQLGVVVIDERLLAEVDPGQLRELTSRWAGVLVTLPAPAGSIERGHDELQRLLRRALGYHVKL